MVQTEPRIRDMRFGTWDVRNVSRAGSFTAAARELWIFSEWDVGHELDRAGSG